MFIEFALAYTRYFFTKHLAHFFTKYKIPQAPNIPPFPFYNSKLLFPWMLETPTSFQVFISHTLIKDPKGVVLDNKPAIEVNIEQGFLEFNKVAPIELNKSFKLKIPQSDTVIPIKPRLMPINGTCNFRDLGGYVNTDKKMLQWGKVYRSDFLYKTDILGKEQLQQLGINTVVDFRGNKEISRQPDNLPKNIQYVHIPIAQGKKEQFIKKLILSGNANRLQGNKIMQEIYEFFGFESQKQFSQFFKLLTDKKNYPLVFHCTAGKDRTGFASALLLALLGMDKTTILHDYMLSNYYRHQDNHKYAEIGKHFMKKEIINDFLIVQPAYLLKVLEAIDFRFNSISTYFTQQLSIDYECQESIKKILLKPL